MPELTLISLPYRRDSEQLIAQLAPLPMPVIFDSGVSEPGDGHYDILTAMPCAYIKVVDGSLSSSDNELQKAAARSNLDIFPLLQVLIDKNKRSATTATEDEPAIPFCGGLAGYLGYPVLDKGGDYRINNAFVGLYNWALIQDHHRQECFIVAQPGFPQQKLQLILDQLKVISTPKQKARPHCTFTRDMKRPIYNQAFDKIKAYISAGDCYQVNLAQRFSAPYDGNSLAAYLALRATARSPFSAYLDWGDSALLCVSPERFISHHQGKVFTQPIKGTRARSSDPDKDRRMAQELLDSVKDIAENLMIVDLLRNDLGKVCRIGSVKVERLFELRSFTNVHHLVSTISGKLDENSTVLNLLEHCFPGGSITGAPKLRAMEIIEELEPHPREVYCGCVMYLDYAGNMDSNITIRTLLSRNDKLYCWAGGGIVDDSACEAEYQECFDKIASIKSALGDGV